MNLHIKFWFVKLIIMCFTWCFILGIYIIGQHICVQVEIYLVDLAAITKQYKSTQLFHWILNVL